MATGYARLWAGIVPARRALPVLLCALLAIGLAGCSRGEDEEPTVTPDDRLAIVTPTPGTPIPQTPTPRASEETYIVQPGDSLSSIATRFGTTQEAIQEANGIDDPNSIYAGQELIIPAR